MKMIQVAVFGVAIAFFSPVVEAGECKDAKAAEVTRLSEDIKVALQKNQYSRADRSYGALEALGKKCTPLIKDMTHFNGGIAARSLGNMGDAKERFELADEVPEAANELAAINSAYGAVSITKSPKNARTLTFTDELPFDPTVRIAIDFGKKEIADDGNFVGLLPIGHYKLGTVTFEVTTSHTTTIKQGKLKK